MLMSKIDRENRINELKHEAEETADCPPNLAEQFWEHVEAYEKAPQTTHFRRLQQAGVAMPAPEKLNEKQLAASLWEVIHALEAQRVFLVNTNHLSDRELYTELLKEGLQEVVADLPIDEFSSCVIDLVGSGSEEHIHLHLKYYAGTESRRHWAEEFPEYEVPAHEEPPFDRDRFLPKETFEQLAGGETEAG
jgi:hypothetical protein